MDLEKIAPKIEKNLGFKCVIRSFDDENQNNCILSIQGTGIRALGRLLKSMGAPEGDKIKQEFLVPEWVFLLKPRLKKRFLEVFLSNEMCVKNFTHGDQFPDMGIKMRKMKDKETNLISFLNQIGSLLNEFRIGTGEAKVVNELVDKEGRKSDAFIRIRQNFINVLKLTETFNLLFAKEKQNVLDGFNQVVKRKLVKELGLIEKFEEVTKLKGRGLKQVEIAKELGLGKWMVQKWFTGGQPRFLNQKEDLIKLLNSANYEKNNMPTVLSQS